MAKVLLLSPPWRAPNNASLALGTLRPILERSGIEADTLYGSLHFPLTPSPVEFLESFSSWLFVSHLYPEVSRERVLDAMMRQYLDDHNMQGVRFPSESVTFADVGMGEETVRRGARADIERAGVCVERCVELAASPEYDIVALSATFESQVPAALAIAQRLKRRNPEVRIILGGAACFEAQGDGLAASFPVLDAVCHTEGEDVIVPLVRALRDALPLAAVPGIAYRDASGVMRHNPAPPLLTDLDTLPVPEFHDFLEQFAASPWNGAGRGLGKPQLFFETSRGCWWGQKHLCSFCGLNPTGLTFRRKSPDRAYEEIRGLYRSYPEVDYLQATDNILDMGYLESVLPRLAAMEQDADRPLKMFFEIKSNLRREQVEAMVAGGVAYVQPGIESFSDDILAGMDKGSTGLGQVQFLKYAYEAGTNVVYNILVRNPGERAEWYREMTGLIPYIEHLPSPMGIVACLLERFSPYHRWPERYGIRDVRPKEYYSELYPDPTVDLDRISYIFEYDHDMLQDDELVRAQREFVHRAVEWTNDWQPNRAYYLDAGSTIFVTDRRRGALRTGSITGASAEVFRSLDRVRSRVAIPRQFPELDPSVLQCQLDTWVHGTWVCRDPRDRYLSVLPRANPDAANAAIQPAAHCPA